ncbi:hypothetical protein [Corynebacterium glutamicum]|uniref:hypothetical protein n=1 Tax=Corynebacterium glutamicum TaxID=1718 RepID=UPI0003012800|nr:hypothetical protein [Corynebacterium glutamicum]HJE11944.1 hypothetical protein [Corynebacterium glutamicum]
MAGKYRSQIAGGVLVDFWGTCCPLIDEAVDSFEIGYGVAPVASSKGRRTTE